MLVGQSAGDTNSGSFAFGEILVPILREQKEALDINAVLLALIAVRLIAGSFGSGSLVTLWVS